MIEYLAAFIAGGAIKHVDFIEDKKKGRGFAKWPLAVIAGLCMGYVLSFSEASVLFAGVIAAQVLMGKIDKKVHGLAVVLAAAVPIFLGMEWADMGLLLPFFAVAALDEVDFGGALRAASDYRLWLKAFTFLIGILWGSWAYFLAIMCFDIAYMAMDYSMGGKGLAM